VRGGVERGVVRVAPNVLQDSGAFGDEVAAEGVIGVEGVGEVDGGYWAPSQDLLKSDVVYDSLL